MLNSKFALKLTICLTCLLSTSFLNSPVNPQEPNALQKQIDELREGQKTILKELHEIKGLLQDRAAIPNLPPPNLIVSASDNPSKGDKNALVTLVEFSDYQCPFCARHFHETLPQIEREYIKTGRLKYVLRNFPLEAMHRDAFKAAEAVNCAGEQGKYWQMHDRLFQNQNQLGDPEWARHAKAIGLNLPAFQQCLSSGKQAAAVRKDQEDGQRAGVQGTPTFFVGVQDSDSQTIKVLKMIVGAQPYPEFKAAIEGALNQKRK